MLALWDRVARLRMRLGARMGCALGEFAVRPTAPMGCLPPCAPFRICGNALAGWDRAGRQQAFCPLWESMMVEGALTVGWRERAPRSALPVSSQGLP